MDLNLAGKRALVCGSSSGIGLAAAIELSKSGASVTLFARNEEKLRIALRQLDQSQNQKHDFIVADFTFPEKVSEAISNHLRKTEIFHILINNTGGPKGGAITEADSPQFLQAFKSHLICNQILATNLLPGMKSAGFGRIVNVISTSVKQPIPGLGVSNTVRWTVASWAKTLATEVGPFGITVNNVLPGYTRTNRYDSLMESQSMATGKSLQEVEEQLLQTIPLRKIGTPEDLGAAIAFLCSPAAGYISGINLPVDGGRLLCL